LLNHKHLNTSKKGARFRFERFFYVSSIFFLEKICKEKIALNHFYFTKPPPKPFF